MNKISSINLGKFNNAEYANFSQRTARLIQTATPAALGLTQAMYDAYAQNINRLSDIVAQSRISEETVDIAQVDRECDELIVYINAAIRTAKMSPVADQRAAGTLLYNVTKPYIGMQSLAQGQQVQTTRGYLMDLGKDQNVDAIDTLVLGPAIQQLRQKNNQYAALLDSRAASQVANKLDPGYAVREEMNVQYDELVTLAFVTSVANPSPAADTFVTAMNKLIADTNTAFNQRMAQKKSKKDEEENPEQNQVPNN